MGLSVRCPVRSAHEKKAFAALQSARMEFVPTPLLSHAMMSAGMMASGDFRLVIARCPTLYHQCSIVFSVFPLILMSLTQASSKSIHSSGGCR